MSSPLSELLDADRTAVVVVDDAGHVESLNAAMLSLLDVESIDDVGPGTRAHDEMISFLDQLPVQLRQGEMGSWSGDVDRSSHRGDTQVLRATAHVMPSPSGRSRTSLLLHDVSEARRQLSALHQRATHDSLTGFISRQRMLNELADALGRRRRASELIAVIAIDLDHLKKVNDALGHAAGDRLLASAGRRLEGALRPDDRAARVGGDEFLIMCRDVRDRSAALEVAERVERALRGTAAVGSLSIEVSASVGVAVDDGWSSSEHRNAMSVATTLVGAAERAMKEAKRLGGARAVLHRGADGIEAVGGAAMVAALSDAITHHALTVDYQPVFSFVSQRAVGAEALARWHHPTRGPIDPDNFITLAEESGLIVQLGDEILDLALRDLRSWLDAHAVPRDFAMHVNVSIGQLASPHLVDTVAATLRRHRVSPHQLVLETRQPSLSDRSADVDRSIRALRQLGVNVALDDFGIGAQSLDLLTDVGADVVKLDGSLALPPGSTETQVRLVRAIVLLAHALDVGVVAERVDGIEQLRRLQAAGCDMVQGNLLGPPRTSDELALISAVEW